MKLNKQEKVIVALNLRSGMKSPELGMFDEAHLKALHEKICQNLDHLGGLYPGVVKTSSSQMNEYVEGVGKTASAVLLKSSGTDVARELAGVYIKTVSAAPFSSFNKHVGLLVVDGIAKSSGNAIDWKQVKGKELDAAMNSFNADLQVTQIFESATMPKQEVSMTPLETREVRYNRQQDAVPSPRATETYLL